MLFSLISAILLILAFPNFNLSYLVFVGFVPLFFALHNKSPKKAFFISYVCGFLFYLGTLYWLYHVTIVGLIVLCLYLAIYFGIFGVFTCYVLRVTGYRFLFLPAIWISLEYLQAHLFTGFGWALLGYSQYKNLPFIQIADFSGVYGVSFVIMMLNVCVWMFIAEIRRQKTEIGGRKNLFSVFCLLSSVALILIIVYSYGFFRLHSGKDSYDKIKVSVIQGNIPQDLKWNPDAADEILRKYIVLTKTAALDAPDLIVWPETSFPGYWVSDRDMTDEVLAVAKEIKIPLLVGANTEEGFDVFNSAVLISENGEIEDRYDKIHLVPFGEYVPFSKKLPILRKLILGELGEFTPGHDFKVFYHPPKFSVLICFEDIFPELARRFVKNGAKFLVVITNDAWYGNSGASYQHAACSVFRAIENRVPVVRCANTGYSCFIDKNGRIYDEVEKDGSELFVTNHKTSDVLY